MKTIFLLNYGSDLEHERIDTLVKEMLMPFRNLGYDKINKNIPKNPDVKLIIDTFDINKEKHIENLYYLEEFYITDKQFERFKEEFTKYNGCHLYCRPNHRGHYYIHINNIEYTARLFVTIDNKEIILIDDESIYNDDLRRKVYHLPENFQSLEISLDKILNYNDREKIVQKWISEIINF